MHYSLTKAALQYQQHTTYKKPIHMLSHPANNLLLRAGNKRIVHGITIGVKIVLYPRFPVSSEKVIKYLHLERKIPSTIGTEGRRIPSVPTVNSETMINRRLINEFDFVGPDLECAGHAVVGVRVIFGDSNGDGGDRGA